MFICTGVSVNNNFLNEFSVLDTDDMVSETLTYGTLLEYLNKGINVLGIHLSLDRRSLSINEEMYVKTVFGNSGSYEYDLDGMVIDELQARGIYID